MANRPPLWPKDDPVRAARSFAAGAALYARPASLFVRNLMRELSAAEELGPRHRAQHGHGWRKTAIGASIEALPRRRALIALGSPGMLLRGGRRHGTRA